MTKKPSLMGECFMFLRSLILRHRFIVVRDRNYNFLKVARIKRVKVVKDIEFRGLRKRHEVHIEEKWSFLGTALRPEGWLPQSSKMMSGNYTRWEPFSPLGHCPKTDIFQEYMAGIMLKEVNDQNS